MRKTKILFFLLIAILLFSNYSYQPANAKEDDLVPLIKRARQSVVLIHSLDSSRTLISTGSGFFISANGYIITNQHVIDKASYVTVHFDKTLRTTQRSVPAQVIRVYRDIDIAVLKIEVSKVPFLKIDYDEPEVGENVIIVGYPLASRIGASDITVSRGILTSKKNLEGTSLYQTDAAVNPGNSGGPLISTKSGKVIGIVRLRMKPDIAQNIGFAIPAQNARYIMDPYSGPKPIHTPTPSYTPTPYYTPDPTIKLAITEAVMCEDVVEWKPIRTNNTFYVPPGTNKKLYAFIRYQGATPYRTTIQHKWYYENTLIGEASPYTFKYTSGVFTGWQTYKFRSGDYRVDIFVNGQFYSSLNFRITTSPVSTVTPEDGTYKMKIGDKLTWTNLKAAKITYLFYQGKRVYVPNRAKIQMTFYNVSYSPAQGITITNPRGFNDYGSDFKVPGAPKYCILLSQYTIEEGSPKNIYNYWAKYKPNVTKASVYTITEVGGYLSSCINDTYYGDNSGTYSITVERLE